MFQKYYELIQKMISNLGGNYADISLKSYIKVVLSSLWLVFSYVIIALGVSGILSAPYFMYTMGIKKVIYNKNKDINNKIDLLVNNYMVERDKLHIEYKSGEGDKLREVIQDKEEVLKVEIRSLLEQKDLSIIWKSYLMFAPLLIVYVAFVIPLILIIIDLTFKTASTTLTLSILSLYFVGLISFIVATYKKIYTEERGVKVTYM